MRMCRLGLLSATSILLYVAAACATGGGGGSAEPQKPGKSAASPQAPAHNQPASPVPPTAPAAVSTKPGAPVPPPAPPPANPGRSGLVDDVEGKIKKAGGDPKTKEAVASCKSEAEKYCKAVEREPKALFSCLKQNEAKLAPLCKAEVEAFLKTHK